MNHPACEGDKDLMSEQRESSIISTNNKRLTSIPAACLCPGARTVWRICRKKTLTNSKIWQKHYLTRQQSHKNSIRLKERGVKDNDERKHLVWHVRNDDSYTTLKRDKSQKKIFFHVNLSIELDCCESLPQMSAPTWYFACGRPANIKRKSLSITLCYHHRQSTFNKPCPYQPKCIMGKLRTSTRTGCICS